MEDKFVKDSMYAIKDKTGKLIGKMIFDGSKGKRLFFRQNGHICIVERDAVGSATLIRASESARRKIAAGKCENTDIIFNNKITQNRT